MHRHVSSHLMLIAALFCLSSAVHGFWDYAEGNHAAAKHDYGPKSYHDTLLRRMDPESDSDEDLPTNLGPCVKRCILEKAVKNADGSKVKRADVLPDGSCTRESSPCSEISDSSHNATHGFQKRASGRPLPGFGSQNDLRRKTQQQSAAWVMQRLPDPTVYGMNNGVQMLWDQNSPGQWIDLKVYRAKLTQKAYGIPTSFFAEPGNEVFAWGTIGLVGCSVYTVVKPYTPEDPNPAVYMAHIWETPGFSNDIDTERTWTLAQQKAYIKDFVTFGFPRSNYDRWVSENNREHPTAFQESLATYSTKLENGHAWAMHPLKYDPVQQEGGGEQYVQGEGPQHPEGLELLHKTVTSVMKKKVTWQNDFLYLPAREDDAHSRAWNTPSGRSLFEYDPSFDLGNGQTTRMGMLLYEDGGGHGRQNPDGTFEPGPDGPWFFNFGTGGGSGSG